MKRLFLLARAPLALLLLFAAIPSSYGSPSPNKVYFVSGDAGRFLWRDYPFAARRPSEMLKMALIQTHGNITGELPEEFAKTDLLTALHEQWTSRFIRSVIRELRRKGYSVELIPQIDVREFLRILADEDTLAVFHGGHSYVGDDFDSYGLTHLNQPQEIYLSIYDHGKPSALTDQVIANAAESLDQPYQASPSLQLFFTGSCYAGYCESQIRNALKLNETTRFMTTRDELFPDRPGRLSTYENLTSAFRIEVKQWVESLPDITPTSESCARLLGE